MHDFSRNQGKTRLSDDPASITLKAVKNVNRPHGFPWGWSTRFGSTFGRHSVV